MSASKRGASKRGASKRGASKRNASKRNASKRGASKRGASKRGASKRNASKRVTKKRTFKKKDYYSGDGMLTAVWGPSMWHFLHTMSFNYPVNPSQEDKSHYKEFMMTLQYVLPCKYCRQNLKNNYKVFPLKKSDLASRDSFSRYVYKLHEMVNKLLKKKSGLTYCDVRERYEHFRSRCTDDKPKLFDLKAQKDTQLPDKDKEEKTHANKTRKNKKGEKGCTEPLYGKKSKCIIKIVPQEEKCKTMQIDKKCIKSRE